MLICCTHIHMLRVCVCHHFALAMNKMQNEMISQLNNILSTNARVQFYNATTQRVSISTHDGHNLMALLMINAELVFSYFEFCSLFHSFFAAAVRCSVS